MVSWHHPLQRNSLEAPRSVAVGRDRLHKQSSLEKHQRPLLANLLSLFRRRGHTELRETACCGSMDSLVDTQGLCSWLIVSARFRDNGRPTHAW